MLSAVAFLPWVAIDEALTIGPLRLLPYLRGKLPGDLPNATQSDIDGVLNAYANRPRSKIKKATILKLGQWQTGMDAQNVVPALFRACDALAFAALASFLLPLVFKKVAAATGLLKLDDYDVETLRRIDAYLLHVPFTFDWMAEDSTHPWVEIDSLALVARGLVISTRGMEHQPA